MGASCSACRRATLAAIILLAGCATARDSTPALMGVWGGDHVELTVATLDSAIEFDCAEGMFVGPLAVAEDGRFDWGGTYQRGTGGPDRVGPEPPEVSARYIGVTRGGDMTLSVRLDDGQVIGPFTLERFKDAQLTRCL